nr:ribonuclease H-like domain-containing protein [Tanacetum cinerariifolium]
MAIVQKGKQRGHLPGVGKLVLGKCCHRKLNAVKLGYYNGNSPITYVPNSSNPMALHAGNIRSMQPIPNYSAHFGPPSFLPHSVGIATASQAQQQPLMGQASFTTAHGASSHLNNSVTSLSENFNTYSVVPPPPAQVYSPPKKDMSWTGLPKFADDTITDYSRPLSTIESNSDDLQNRNSSVTKTEESSSTILSKPVIKFVKAAVRPTETKTNKVETVKKPATKYAEMYKKTSKSSNVRGNQRNWNNLKSQQLCKNFLIKNKACFNCGEFDHLSYDYGKWVDHGKTRAKNNYTHKSIPPRTVFHKADISSIKTNRPNMNAAPRPNVNNARPKTTQDLMIILIQRVKRLERELKARTLPKKIHKVNRGRSRPSSTIESNSDDFQNKNSSVTETGESSSTILSKPVIKFVKAAVRPTEIKTNKVETRVKRLERELKAITAPIKFTRLIEADPGGEVMRRLFSSNFISYNKEKPPILCQACQLGKHVRLSFVSSSTVIRSCFDIIHSDV